MKRLLSLTVFLMLFVPSSHAQPPASFRDLMGRRPAISPVAIGGISLTSIGVVAVAVGFMLQITNGDTGGQGSNSGPTPPTYNTGYKIMGVGAGLAVVGGIMMAVGFSNDHNRKARRWSVAAPKRNQLGLAYNF